MALTKMSLYTKLFHHFCFHLCTSYYNEQYERIYAMLFIPYHNGSPQNIQCTFRYCQGCQNLGLLNPQMHSVESVIELPR